MGISLELYLAYIAACFVIAIVPGPTVTVIVANSLAHGARAGLLNVAGTQLGLALMMAVLVVGLSSVIAAMAWAFEIVRWVGAAYLVWIGLKLLTSDPATTGKASAPRGGFFLQGFLVLMANPKALLWFGAFIPQFVDPKGDYVAQIVVLGVTAMAVALVSDGAYAVATGKAGSFLSQNRVKIVSRASGACLIGGGVWLALTRAR